MEQRASVASWRRLKIASGVLVTVVVAGTIGYIAFGFTVLDAIYQTVTTITTVGFREVRPFGEAEKVFTVALIVIGVGTALYTFTSIVEVGIEGHFGALVGRRRMDRKIAAMRGHVIVCGVGRVGRAIARQIAESGTSVVVVDQDEARLQEFVRECLFEIPVVVGDATLDAVLRQAGIEHAGSIVAALAADADNLFITLSARDLRPDLFIVARAREEGSVGKLERAGANRVVNPQELGAQRMAAFIVRPHVAEFVDVVMHDREHEFRLHEIAVGERSPVVGATLQALNLREITGAMIFAIREADGTFVTNPGPDSAIGAGAVLIAIGTDDSFEQLDRLVAG